MENEKTTRSFEILSSRRNAFEKQMARLARKAAKLGVDAPSYTMGESMIVDRSTVTEGGQTHKYKVEVFPTTVTSIVVKIPGWTFLATLEHLAEGETLLRAIAEGEIPAKYRTVGPVCDHCKLARKRNDTYLVRSDAGEIKQIGRDTRTVGGNQDAAIGEFRMFSKRLRQRAGIRMTEAKDDAAFEFAREMRQRTMEVLYCAFGHESAAAD